MFLLLTWASECHRPQRRHLVFSGSQRHYHWCGLEGHVVSSWWGRSWRGQQAGSLYNTQVYSIFFFLDYCISVVVLPRSVVCSWGVQDQYSWCGLPKVVCFLRGSRSLLWCVVFVIWFWLLNGLLSGFWGLDVALGVRVNQYTSVCVILSFLDLTYICFKLFLLTADKNNRLFRQNNRLFFWYHPKTVFPRFELFLSLWNMIRL